MTRVRLAYPKIPDSKKSPLEKCIAFEKYDGTNLHWVWEPELGWYAFGTRRNRFDLDEQGIAEFNQMHLGLDTAPELFLQDFATPLETIFKTNATYVCPEVTVFTEFLGSNSFAGLHKDDDPKRLVLFDVEVAGKMLSPEQFIQDFSSLNIAKVIYQGKLTGRFIEDIRAGKYPVVEGVVCKGKNASGVWMVKIKTQAYMQKLKQAFQDDWEKYWE
jgi:hypothetical protein